MSTSTPCRLWTRTPRSRISSDMEWECGSEDRTQRQSSSCLRGRSWGSPLESSLQAASVPPGEPCVSQAEACTPTVRSPRRRLAGAFEFGALLGDLFLELADLLVEQLQ